MSGSGGTATSTFTTTTLSVNGSPHTIKAVYTDNVDPDFQTSNGSLSPGQTVTQAASTVMPNAVSTTYSGVALNNATYSDNTSNYSITGFVNGDSIASAGVTLSGSMFFNGSTSTSVKNVGTYSQAQGTLSLSSNNNNYSMTFTHGAE